MPATAQPSSAAARAPADAKGRARIPADELRYSGFITERRGT